MNSPSAKYCNGLARFAERLDYRSIIDRPSWSMPWELMLEISLVAIRAFTAWRKVGLGDPLRRPNRSCDCGAVPAI
jgi:hypothetical protein